MRDGAEATKARNNRHHDQKDKARLEKAGRGGAKRNVANNSVLLRTTSQA